MTAFCTSSCILLVVVAQLVVGALPGSLAQPPTQSDCSTLHQACTACSVVTTAPGTRQKLCSSCTPAYVVSQDKTTCDCAPGYYYSSSGGAGAVRSCLLCTKGSWCPGGPAAPAARYSCGAFLTTVSTGAVSPASCITQPGAAFMRGVGSATACSVGSYNAGGNQRNCTNCPVGMSTPAVGAISWSACAALPGWSTSQRVALPCAQGTFQPALSNTSRCTRCPTGSTTRSIRSTALSDCSIALPGFHIEWEQGTPSTPHPVPCALGTYSTGYTNQPCMQCPLGLQTPSTGSTSVAACSAPAGFGFYCSAGPQPAGVGPVSTKMLQDSGSPCVLQCPPGSFKEGWGRQPCIACGVNFRGPAGAASAQQCYLPVGWGSTPARDGSTLLVARKCLRGLFGVSQPQYGNSRRHPCQPCPAHTTTPDMAPNVTSLIGQEAADALAAIVVSSSQQCATLPGYGFNGLYGTRCERGFYAVGYTRDPCTRCSVGLTTREQGAASPDDCVAIPGWQRRPRQGISPDEPFTAEECPAGSWGSGGTEPCQPCPPSTTTASAGAADVSECEAVY